jgi:hypothetical protein
LEPERHLHLILKAQPEPVLVDELDLALSSLDQRPIRNAKHPFFLKEYLAGREQTPEVEITKQIAIGINAERPHINHVARILSRTLPRKQTSPTTDPGRPPSFTIASQSCAGSAVVVQSSSSTGRTSLSGRVAPAVFAVARGTADFEHVFAERDPLGARREPAVSCEEQKEDPEAHEVSRLQ